MGVLSWAEAHPFTIASSGDGEDGMVLLCKRAGGWTGRLWDIANEGARAGKDGMEHACVRVLVEGPYGKRLF
jgi:ferric-chelate reductase